MAAGFTMDQINEITEGKEAGLDVSVYAKKDFFAIQMRQIRLGLEESLDVKLYAKPEYDWFQMEEIRKGLKWGVDVSKYASPDIPYDKMRQVRKGLNEGIDLSGHLKLDAGILRQLRRAIKAKVDIIKYVKAGYVMEQLEQIRLALQKGLDISPYLSKEFRGPAIYEIALGLEKGLDVEVYARVEYGWQQMREIRLGLENRVDVSIYADPLYSWQQMHEIRIGLEDGLDVSHYSSLMYSARDMKRRREKMEAYYQEGAEAEIQERASELLDNFLIIISQDEMEAYIEIEDEQKKFARADILNALKQKGITQGIIKEGIDALLDGKGFSAPVLIAKGLAPKNGKDGWYEFFFRTDLSHAPVEMPDGTVNYQDVEWFEMVEKGQKLAYYHEAEDGTGGITVTGKRVPAKKGREQSVLSGNGFAMMSDMKTYMSTIKGRIELYDNKITISKILVLEEMTLATGKVEFDGSIYVKGNVGYGTMIKADGDVVVCGSVETAVIESKGSILLKNGINASGTGMIRAEKSVHGKFLEAVHVYAGENIQANYCLNCELYAEGYIQLLGTKGILAGGLVQSLKGIVTHSVGNRAGIPTYLKLGMNEGFVKEQNSYDRQIREASKELSILGNAYLEMQRKHPPEVRNTMEIYLKLENAIFTVNKKLEEIHKHKDQLEEKLEGTKDVKAVIKGTLYEGTTIEINGHSWMAKEMQNVTIKQIADRVAVYSN